MESMAEEFRKREDVKPDQWTLKWWDERFTNQAKATRGATHACNLVLAEIEDIDAAVKKLHARVDSQTEEIHEASVAIGKLQEAMEKSREAYAELKKKVK